jgi:PIN domain nuclease of toxin-antitoxin system
LLNKRRVDLGDQYQIRTRQAAVPKFYEDTLREQGFIELEITWKHGKAVQELPLIHRDPFDRLLVAQAIVEGFGLLSVDERIREYAVEVL